MSKSQSYLLIGASTLAIVIGLSSPIKSSAVVLIDLNYGAETEVDTNAGVQGQGSTQATSTVGLDTSAGSLEVDQTISINRAQVEASGESAINVEPEEVEINADLQAYALGALSSDDNVEEMNFTGESVEVRYKQAGRLLALIPITFTVSAVAHADGTVEVNYPWYSFITVDSRKEIETEVRVAVNNTLAAQTVGSVRAEGEVDNPRFTAAESALIASQVQLVLKSRFESDTAVDNSLE